MKKKDAKAGKFKGLRDRAEKDLKKRIEKIQKESKGDFKKVIHELHVHQIELEMQNEELRQAQRELETSRNKYSDLYDLAPVGYFAFDKKGVIVEANLTGCQMLGVKRAALIKKPFNSFVDKGSQDKFYLHRGAITRSAAKESCEITLVRKDKTTLDVLLESIPAASAENDLALCRTAITDITERKKTERRYSTILKTIQSGFWIFDKEGKLLEVNDAYCKMSGYSREELLKMRISDVEAAETSAEVLRHIESVHQKGYEQFESRHRRRDGSVFDVDIRTTRLDAEGYRHATFVLDITERKEAESNQALVAAILRMLNRGGDMHFVIGEMLRLIRESTCFDAVGLRLRKGEDYPYYEQNGFSDDFVREENFLCVKGGDGAIIRDADGKVTLECTCGLVLSGRTDPSMACFTGGGSFWTNKSTELLALTPEADPRTNPRNRCIHIGYQSVGLFPVRSGSEIVGLLQLNGRHEGRFTPELIRFFESLADNIGLALKRMLAEEQLKQLAEELERSNRELEEFAHITSHDLREPLRAISGFIQLLDQRYKDKWDEKSKEYINFAANGAKRLEELLNGLLEYSRVQTQGQRAMPLPAGVALNAAIRNLQKSIDETGASITFDKLPDVNADGSQLTRVFRNLIDNAIKFHSDRKPEIHIGYQKEGNYRQFSVRDNGIGIEPQNYERVFKIFQRLNTREQYPGYGVGLTICQKIVERHGGRIWVESQPGQGSTFYFTIPE
jgi:PAS domain S-box-containing protein